MLTYASFFVKVYPSSRLDKISKMWYITINNRSEGIKAISSEV